MTGYETVMVAVLAALKATPSIVGSSGTIRRAHRTLVPKDAHPAVHLIDGRDQRVTKPTGRHGRFAVSVFVRDDAGVSASDALRLLVVARVKTVAIVGVVIAPPGDIAPDTEIADADASRLDMSFEFTYPTCDEWSLELA